MLQYSIQTLIFMYLILMLVTSLETHAQMVQQFYSQFRVFYNFKFYCEEYFMLMEVVLLTCIKLKHLVWVKILFLRLCLSNIDSCTACTNVSKFQDDYTGHRNVIENFHSSVSTGPLFVCKSCTQTWFKHSVKKATGISEDFLMYCSLR